MEILLPALIAVAAGLLAIRPQPAPVPVPVKSGRSGRR